MLYKIQKNNSFFSTNHSNKERKKNDEVYDAENDAHDERYNRKDGFC